MNAMIRTLSIGNDMTFVIDKISLVRKFLQKAVRTEDQDHYCIEIHSDGKTFTINYEGEKEANDVYNIVSCILETRGHPSFDPAKESVCTEHGDVDAEDENV
jgi:hypothetical protein